MLDIACTLSSKVQFRQVNSMMRSRAPKISNPRRVASSYLVGPPGFEPATNRRSS